MEQVVCLRDSSEDRVLVRISWCRPTWHERALRVMMRMKFNTIEEAIEDIRQGKMIILVDDEDRENEGDLTMAAEKVTPEAINFMATLWPRPDLFINDAGAPDGITHPADGGGY